MSLGSSCSTIELRPPMVTSYTYSLGFKRGYLAGISYGTLTGKHIEKGFAMDSMRRYRISDLKGRAANRNRLPKRVVIVRAGKVLLVVAAITGLSWLAYR